jgi:hypothetical protein
MKRAFVMGLSVVLVSFVTGRTSSLAGHGHGGGAHGNGHGGASHKTQTVHEAPKHSNKSAQHPSKPAPKPQGKPAGKPHPKPASPQGAHKNNNEHKNAAGKPGEHSAHPAEKGLSASGSQEKHHDDGKHHEHKHHEHHEHHHDRWVNGHRHYWSEQGFWVDATTGLPVPDAAVGVPVDGSDPGVPTPSGPVAPGRRQVFFNIQPSDLDSYDAAAAAAGITRDEWIRSRLNEAVRRELK